MLRFISLTFSCPVMVVHQTGEECLAHGGKKTTYYLPKDNLQAPEPADSAGQFLVLNSFNCSALL